MLICRRFALGYAGEPTPPAQPATVIQLPVATAPGATGTVAPAVIDSIAGWLSGQTFGLPNVALAAGAGLLAFMTFRDRKGR